MSGKPKPAKPGSGGKATSSSRGPAKGAVPHPSEYVPKLTTTKREEAEVRALEKRVAEGAPARGSMEVAETEFSQLPLSRYTLNALHAAKFRVMTQIQRTAIYHALAGRDILGAAKTGSGKTLSFLIPVLERLYRQRWTATDGLGALIISPTHELAAQIFEVLKTVGRGHFALSAGVVMGGHDFEEEQATIGQMSILVATPGRLLQHMEQTPDFDASNLRMLVLDEADRLLDMGFEATLNAIVANLPPPPQRQTLLFSATQTKSVKDLARLSLSSPEYVSVHDKATTATPLRLAQAYVVCPLQDKLNMLYSFIRSHLTSKVIVFVSSCKQSRFLFEAFRRLRPGVPLQHLHGKMKQQRRMLVYYDFLKKPACVLFATDIAARGLDFPNVDWVLQLDCPEDVATYIHRSGRTARFKAKGHALTVLLPSEAPAMVKALEDAKVPVKQTFLNPSKAVSMTSKLAAEVAADPELKYLAQRAFVSYVRSVVLQSRKDIFDAQALPLDAYAESLGLASAPVVKLPPKGAAGDAESLREEAHKRKNENKGLQRLKEQIAKAKAARKAAAAAGVSDSDSDDDDDDEEDEEDSGSDSGSYDDSDEEDDSDEDDSEDEDESDEDDDSNDDDDEELEGGLFAAKKKASSKARGGGAGGDSEEDEASSSSSEGERLVPADTRGMSSQAAARIRAIERDVALLGEGGARKGADGLTPFQRVALAKGGGAAAAAKGSDPAALAAAVEAHRARVASRLEKAAGRDREHEKMRIRQKHREERLRAKGIERSDDDEEEEEEGGVTLGGMSDGSGSGSEEDAAPRLAGTKRGRQEDSASASSSSSSEDSSDDDDSDSSDSDAPAPARRNLTMVAVASKPAPLPPVPAPPPAAKKARK